jgi:beta-lactamase class A
MLNNKFVLILVAVITAGLGYWLGRYTGKEKGKESIIAEKQHDIKELRETGYKFISPLLECQDVSPSSKNNMIVLENKIKQYVSEIKSKKKANHISIYFRELNNGLWIGLGENEPYSPASLLKVPIMIAALKKAEKSPGFLEKRITYKSHTTDTTNPNILDSLIKTGNNYTIENLIYRMIAFSDNEAKNLILENLDTETLDNTYLNLGIDVPGLRSPDDFMSVKEYASFFRVLYNATYLDKKMSEKALEILSKSTFKKGLPSGVPSNVVVAHKFGERGFADSNVKQLHDCGIIYKEGNPYILCVMTRGSDFDELTKVISGVSALVYSEFGDK